MESRSECGVQLCPGSNPDLPTTSFRGPWKIDFERIFRLRNRENPGFPLAERDEMQGGTFSISSLGGIGGNFFTPIINPPEVAILGVGKTFDKIKKVNGQFIVRKMLPISLSYDHRVIDGAEGARFCVHLSKSLGKDFAFKLAV